MARARRGGAGLPRPLRRDGGVARARVRAGAGARGVTPDEIYRRFRGLIVTGRLGAGERLPTVRQTAADLAVAPGTAAKAYRMLEQDGLVVTRTAAGTRVAPSAAVLPASIVRRVRDLVEIAEAEGVTVDQVADALRASWSAR
ncbi:GntR family transcriptional regulator [Microbacterium marinilacus]|nr:GntR family transcriptional regulator [Microbacterium marinilacus]